MSWVVVTCLTIVRVICAFCVRVRSNLKQPFCSVFFVFRFGQVCGRVELSARARAMAGDLW